MKSSEALRTCWCAQFHFTPWVNDHGFFGSACTTLVLSQGCLQKVVIEQEVPCQGACDGDEPPGLGRVRLEFRSLRM